VGLTWQSAITSRVARDSPGLLVWLILGRMMQLDAFWVNVGVLIASLPSAGNIYVLAQRYDADPQRVSAAILLSTLVSVVSFPCVAWLALD
jgi:malonate transporter